MSEKTRKTFAVTVMLTLVPALMTVLFFALYRQNGKAAFFKAGGITLTVFYQFAMRLTVGEWISARFRKRDFPQDRFGFPIRAFEKDLYKRWNVKRRKKSVITAKPELFDLRRLSPRELLHNVLQAELVHRVSMGLSLLPLLFIFPFGMPCFMIAASALGCLIDFKYMVIQRYNRPRVIRYMETAAKRETKRGL